jgi:N-acyl-D-aspartate/D-glutamate deacylase
MAVDVCYPKYIPSGMPCQKFLKIYKFPLQGKSILVIWQGTMATVQQGIRFPRWMYDRLQAIADERGFTFTDVVLDLLRQELRAMGITMGIGRKAAPERSLPVSRPDR